MRCITAWRCNCNCILPAPALRCTYYVIAALRCELLPYYHYIYGRRITLPICVALHCVAYYIFCLQCYCALQCYCVPQNCFPARAMRLAGGRNTSCCMRCTYYIVICGPITAYLLLHVMARLKRSTCCTIYILLRMLSYCVVVHANVQLQHLRSALLQAKLITLRIVWLVLPFLY